MQPRQALQCPWHWKNLPCADSGRLRKTDSQLVIGMHSASMSCLQLACVDDFSTNFLRFFLRLQLGVQVLLR